MIPSLLEPGDADGLTHMWVLIGGLGGGLTERPNPNLFYRNVSLSCWLFNQLT